MTKTAIGIDIGSSGLRALEVTGGARPTVRRAAWVPLAPGVVDHGVVSHETAFADALAALWRTAGFTGKKVHLGLGSTSTVIREHTVPAGSRADIRASLDLYVEGALPFDASEAVLDFYGIGDTEHGATASGLLVAARQDDVDSLVAAVEDNGLQVQTIDAVPFALWRAVDDVAGAAALIDFGASSTTLLFARDGVPEFVRVIPIGGDDITVALSRELSLDRPTAEETKHRAHLSRSVTTPGAEHVQAVLRVASREVIGAVRDTMRFIESSRPGLAPTIVHVTGGASRMGGLVEVVTEASGIRAVPLRRLRGTDEPDGLDGDENSARDYAAAFGIASHGVRS